MFLPSLLPAVIVLFVTSMFGRAWDLKTVFPIAFLGCVLIALIAAMSFNRHVKRLKLNADRRSARLVGRDALLSVLTRIESLKLEDVERWKRNRAQSIIHSKPTVEERIRNLSV